MQKAGPFFKSNMFSTSIPFAMFCGSLLHAVIFSVMPQEIAFV